MTPLVLSQSKQVLQEALQFCNEVAQKHFLLLLQHDAADRAAPASTAAIGRIDIKLVHARGVF